MSVDAAAAAYHVSHAAASGVFAGALGMRSGDQLFKEGGKVKTGLWETIKVPGFLHPNYR